MSFYCTCFFSIISESTLLILISKLRILLVRHVYFPTRTNLRSASLHIQLNHQLTAKGIVQVNLSVLATFGLGGCHLARIPPHEDHTQDEKDNNLSDIEREMDCESDAVPRCVFGLKDLGSNHLKGAGVSQEGSSEDKWFSRFRRPRR